MAAPLLQAQIDINAPVARVWELVSDLRRMRQWSPQCRWMKLRGPLRRGTRTFNLNRYKFWVWPTTCTLIEVIPEQKLAFRVDVNGAIWSYELRPIPGGTRVIESRHAEKGLKPISIRTQNAVVGGVEIFERELVDGMNTSLARIKVAAERG